MNWTAQATPKGIIIAGVNLRWWKGERTHKRAHDTVAYLTGITSSTVACKSDRTAILHLRSCSWFTSGEANHFFAPYSVISSLQRGSFVLDTLTQECGCAAAWNIKPISISFIPYKRDKQAAGGTKSLISWCKCPPSALAPHMLKT